MVHNHDEATALESQPTWVQSYINSKEKKRQLYRRTLWFIVISQMFGGAGLAAGITVGALLAEDMLGTNRYAGVPAALFTLGSAGAALIVGRISQRFGRRSGLAVGFLAGGMGAIGVVLAAVLNHMFLLLASLFIYGAGTATNLQARYAGTDLASASQRGTAVSIALVSTTLGAVAGPNLVDAMSRFATAIGVPPLAGPFILAAFAFMFAGLVLFVFLRPDPLMVAKAMAEEMEADKSAASGKTASSVSANRGVIAGTAFMVLTQMVMVAIMTMTPVHMEHHGHGLREVGAIIGVHVAAMYLPSLVTGILVDKIGRTAMAVASAVTLLISGVLAGVAPGDSFLLVAVALALLGLGWNFGLISGTALIVDATTVSNRAKTQGSADVLIALAGASGGALSGVIVAHSSYAILSLVGGMLSLLLIPFAVWSRSLRNKS